MAMIVISGINDCPGFALLDYLANLLSKTLPNFKVHRKVLTRKQWPAWLQEICKEKNWYHDKSPLAWKELAMTGGNSLYIGGVDKFFDYCHEYYGIAFYQDKLKGKHLAKENFERYIIDHQTKDWQLGKKYRVVCITGSRGTIQLLASQMLLLPKHALEEGTKLLLFDDSAGQEELRHLAADLNKLGAPAGIISALVIDSLPVGLKSCDVFVILSGITRRTAQPFEDFLEENKVHMTELAKTYDMFAPVECRVVVASSNDTPACFNATVFVSLLKHHSPENTVVVTADLGLTVLPIVSQAIGVPVSDLTVPPVWGFTGTFGIPRGMVFSQPASLQNGRWRPEPLFPAPGPRVGLARLVDGARSALRAAGVWPGAEERRGARAEQGRAASALAQKYRDPDWDATRPLLSAFTRLLVETSRDEAEKLKLSQEAEGLTEEGTDEHVNDDEPETDRVADA